MRTASTSANGRMALMSSCRATAFFVGKLLIYKVRRRLSFTFDVVPKVLPPSAGCTVPFAGRDGELGVGSSGRSSSTGGASSASAASPSSELVASTASCSCSSSGAPPVAGSCSELREGAAQRAAPNRSASFCNWSVCSFVKIVRPRSLAGSCRESPAAGMDALPISTPRRKAVTTASFWPTTSFLNTCLASNPSNVCTTRFLICGGSEPK
mmetsp:Transcript_51121/g.119728  ORF Transcript_51121/g.119728 Transcript_51121/m.119728 type:complete len:211 (+) Transcript_51121:1303-1935(+)